MTDPTPPPEQVDGLTPLTIEVSDGNPPTIACRGEIDAATSPALREALEGVEAPAVDLDLGAVTFIDSAGIQVIAAAVRHWGPQGRRLSVCAASRPVKRVFDIAGIGDLITT